MAGVTDGVINAPKPFCCRCTLRERQRQPASSMTRHPLSYRLTSRCGGKTEVFYRDLLFDPATAMDSNHSHYVLERVVGGALLCA